MSAPVAAAFDLLSLDAPVETGDVRAATLGERLPIGAHRDLAGCAGEQHIGRDGKHAADRDPGCVVLSHRSAQDS